MQKDFLGFIKKHALFGINEPVLLAVSGGVDSMVMAHLFHQSGFSFGIAHCNFQLRGQESDADERLVMELADNLGVKFHSKHFDTESFAQKQGISIQMAARDLRYGWFEELCDSDGYSKIASAHHKDDNVETVVYNLIRGTSIAGLRGMIHVQGKLVRPLLGFSKEQILSFAKEERIEWREDRSNDSDDYKRNFIRHHITPKLEEVNPSYLDVITSSMAKNREVELVFRNHLEILKSTLVEDTSEGGQRISLRRLEEEGIGPYVLSELLKEFGINYDQSINMLESIGGVGGKQFFGKGCTVTLDREYLFINADVVEQSEEFLIEPETKELVSASKLCFERVAAGTTIDKSENKAYLDFDKLRFPLCLRSWKQGDSFVPLGMTGKKKLSDFMIDSKIPLNLKSQQQVILSDDEIVWFVGQRIDDRYKVTDQTNSIFLITKK